MPLLLASQSATRQTLLKSVGIPFETVASGIDERLVEMPLREKGASSAEIAAHLAEAKARSVAAKQRDRLVLGADQTLSFEGRTFSKPETIAEARAQLAAFSGRTHELHSALCVARDKTIMFATVVTARLTCRSFGQDFIDHYMATAGEAVLTSVGAYQIEGIGLHLFERIEGDHSTILGLPLLPLLEFLRREGCLVG
ncbi:MAG: Maf family protein [Methylovirgula sp.]